MTTRVKKPRKFSLVKFAGYPPEFKGRAPFRKGKVFVFFGEIANMPGHAVLADHKTGKIVAGYHTENFVELSDDEV